MNFLTFLLYFTCANIINTVIFYGISYGIEYYRVRKMKNIFKNVKFVSIDSLGELLSEKNTTDDGDGSWH